MSDAKILERYRGFGTRVSRRLTIGPRPYAFEIKRRDSREAEVTAEGSEIHSESGREEGETGLSEINLVPLD